MKNLFSLPMPGPEEQVDILVQGGPVRIERIVSTGRPAAGITKPKRSMLPCCKGKPHWNMRTAACCRWRQAIPC